MQKRNIEILVGGFVLLGFMGLVFLALKAANLGSMTSSGGSYVVTARFDNIGGLKAKAAVRTAGVVVGRVESIELDDKTFQARVTIAMDKRYVFPKDSSLKILTSGLLGEQYVGLEAGADAAVVDATWRAMIAAFIDAERLTQAALHPPSPQPN